MRPDLRLKVLNNFLLLTQTLVCVFFYLIVWVFAVPFAYNVLKKYTRLSRIIAHLIVFSFLGYYSGYLTIWLISVPVLGLELAYFVDSKRAFREDTFKQLTVLAFIILLHLGAYSIFELFYSGALYLQIETWLDQIQQSMEMLLKSQKPSTYLMESRSWLKILKYVPAFYFGGFIVAFYSCFWRTRVLHRFDLPDSIFWVLLLSFALGFLDFKSFQALASSEAFHGFLVNWSLWFQNLFYTLSVLYFFQGLSVSLHLMHRFKISRFWQNLWYILIIFNLPMILVALGIFDFLFEFRSIKEKSWKLYYKKMLKILAKLAT